MSDVAGDGQAQAGAVPDAEKPPKPPVLTIDSGWEPWYAWHPVRLYMSGRLAWCRLIHRRSIHRCGMAMWDYTDQPEQHANPAPS